MFGFNRRALDWLKGIDTNTVSALIEIDRLERYLRIIMSNQEVFDAYAARISEQNSQIKAAVSVILEEVGKLQAEAVAVAEKPLDTTKMEQAIEQLTAAVDEVEAIPSPVAAPVEEEAAPVEEPVVAPVEEVVEESTTSADSETAEEE